MLTSVASQGFEYGVKHFTSPKTANALTLISEVLQLPETEILFLIQLGSVYVGNQRVIQPQQEITDQSQVRVHTKPRRYNIDHDWRSLIVFENQDFLIANKPAGLPSHPSVDNKIENSLTQFANAIHSQLHITHRLDTLTEGLIVYGKNPYFVKSFNKQLQEKLITKKYVALVESTQDLPPHLIHYMEPSPRAPKKVSDIFQENWDQCELKIENQKKISDHSWVKINLLTGRTHQIRSQMSFIQAAILGDEMYGSKTKWSKNESNQKTNNAIALRAQFIEFNWLDRVHQFELSDEFENLL